MPLPIAVLLPVSRLVDRIFQHFRVVRGGWISSAKPAKATMPICVLAPWLDT